MRMQSGFYLSPCGNYIRLVESFIFIDRWISVDIAEIDGLDYSGLAHSDFYKDWLYLGES